MEKTSQGKTNNHFSNWSPESTLKSISCFLILQSYSLHEFLQPQHGWSALQDDHDLERVPVTWFMGFLDTIFQASLESEHPPPFPVTYVPGCDSLPRQLCIPSVSEAIPKLANICTTTHPVSSAATKNMHVSGNIMHFITSASHAITKQFLSQLIPPVFPLDDNYRL